MTTITSEEVDIWLAGCLSLPLLNLWCHCTWPFSTDVVHDAKDTCGMTPCDTGHHETGQPLWGKRQEYPPPQNISKTKQLTQQLNAGYWTIVCQVTDWTGFRSRGNWRSKIDGWEDDSLHLSLFSIFFFGTAATAYTGNHRDAEPLSTAPCPNPINIPDTTRQIH